MNVNTTSSPRPTDASSLRAVAPLWHTLILLAVLALITYGGIRSHGPSTKGAPPANLVRLYLGVMAGEWALVFFVWRGVRRRGLTLRELMGCRWRGPQAFLTAALVTVVFWFVWEGSGRLMHRLLGPDDTSNVAAMLPRTILEIALWCALSITAGFSEELIYRGYLQRQFAAWTRNSAAAVLIQGVIFGLSHGYQGGKQVVIITVLGILYGMLAWWRRSLVPGMFAHAWSDIYGGWLHP